ncbi:uncharacterized protein LOC124933635 [Impatiens glandulifera]|uniref:uncharacterized protein LOC124933635 n=1 Tax=Impatiens glandulifera TaxID=253017 RepID=UPI001FB12636|nr:uncharacterized protein LOC124933635 [Impatiens glandulifera]
MSNEEGKKCPLCAEEMDWTDQQLKPCKCGYEVCVWCWHQIMDMAEKVKSEGLCPACRTPYDKKKIVGMEENCERLRSIKKDQKNVVQKVKPKKVEVKKDLTNVRVIQRRMAYVIGLPLSLADEDLLQRKEYFGLYGKVSKVSLSRTSGGTIQQFVNDSCSVYITYSKEEEAIRCIQSVHGFLLDGRLLRASFGTAKYCHAWLRNMPCTNPACLYLHKIGAEEDSFSKDEEAALHTRNRVQQIVGAARPMQWRSGVKLPPPLDQQIDPFNPQKELQPSAVSPNSMSSLLSKEKDGVKTTNSLTSFVDIVGRCTVDPDKEAYVDDSNNKISQLCSDFGSVNIDQSNCSESKYLDITIHDVDSPFRDIRVPGNNAIDGSSNLPALGRSGFTPTNNNTSIGGQPCGNYFEDQDFLPFEDKSLEFSEGLDPSSIQTSSLPTRTSNHSNSYLWQGNDRLGINCSAGGNYVNNHPDETSIPKYVSSYSENESQISSISDGYLRLSTSFANDEIIEQLRRLEDGNNTAYNDENSAYDAAVESSIISNILSMDLDSWDDSVNLSHSKGDLLDGADRLRGSWKYQGGSQKSRFSFATDDGSRNKVPYIDPSFDHLTSITKQPNLEQVFHGKPPHNVSRSHSLKGPPGFPVPYREPPPGFSCEKTNQIPPSAAASGSSFLRTLSFPNDLRYGGTSSGMVHNGYDDPTSNLMMGRQLFSSGLGSRQVEPSNSSMMMYEEDAASRHWLLNHHQQQQQLQYPPPPNNNNNYEVEVSARNNGGAYGSIGRQQQQQQQHYNVDHQARNHHHAYNTYGTDSNSGLKYYNNGCMSNGYVIPALEEVHTVNGNEAASMGGEIGRNEKAVGFNSFYGDSMLQMPTSSSRNIYGGVYGL